MPLYEYECTQCVRRTQKSNQRRHLSLSTPSAAAEPSSQPCEPRTIQSRSPALDSSPSCRCVRSSACPASSPSSHARRSCPRQDCTFASNWSSSQQSSLSCEYPPHG